MACVVDAMAKATVSFEEVEASSAPAVRCHVSAWTMCIAIEFLNGPRVLMLRVYAQWKVTERRTAVKNVKAHGCYRSGIPILIDTTHVAPDVLPDVGALKADAGVVAARLTHSRRRESAHDSASRARHAGRRGLHLSLADALHWLTAP